MYICVLHLADSIKRVTILSPSSEKKMKCVIIVTRINIYHYQWESFITIQWGIIPFLSSFLTPFLPFRFLWPTSPTSILTPNCVMLKR
jgi:hypothetical protein